VSGGEDRVVGRRADVDQGHGVPAAELVGHLGDHVRVVGVGHRSQAGRVRDPEVHQGDSGRVRRVGHQQVPHVEGSRRLLAAEAVLQDLPVGAAGEHGDRVAAEVGQQQSHHDRERAGTGSAVGGHDSDPTAGADRRLALRRSLGPAVGGGVGPGDPGERGQEPSPGTGGVPGVELTGLRTVPDRALGLRARGGGVA
jgi:hypothetical protein